MDPHRFPLFYVKDDNALSYYFVFMWTGKSDLKTPRVDVAFFKKGRKNLYFHTKTGMCWQGLNVKGPLNLWTCLAIFSTNQLMRKCLLLTGSQMKKNLNRCPNTPSTQSHNQLQMGVSFKALLTSVLFLEISRQISFNRKMTVRFWLESLVQ